jgi:hypothetical protein
MLVSEAELHSKAIQLSPQMHSYSSICLSISRSEWLKRGAEWIPLMPIDTHVFIRRLHKYWIHINGTSYNSIVLLLAALCACAITVRLLQPHISVQEDMKLLQQYKVQFQVRYLDTTAGSWVTKFAYSWCLAHIHCAVAPTLLSDMIRLRRLLSRRWHFQIQVLYLL